jgi:hypothetical protein
MINSLKINKYFEGRCCFCGARSLIWKLSFSGLPARLGVTTAPPETDRFANLNLVQCEACTLIQTDYFPLNEIYEVLHSTAQGSTWDRHRKALIEFIGKGNVESILEIGPSCNPIARSIPHEYAYYVDFMDQPFELRNNEIYCKEDFLSASFYNCVSRHRKLAKPHFDLIIASHVFEHIKDSNQFMEQCKKYGANKLVISVPNFVEWYNKGYYNAVTPEHVIYPTRHFFYEVAKRHNIAWRHEYFEDHSLFIEFDLTKPFGKNNGSPLEFGLCASWYHNYDMKIYELAMKLREKENYSCAIFGASHLAQFVLMSSESISDKIMFVFDNDTSKHDKRLYGSDKYVFGADHLNKVKTLVIPSSPYTNEIIKQTDSLEHIII